MAMTQTAMDFGRSFVPPPPITARVCLRAGEIAVDFFAGGGGASEGLAAAIGRGPHIAANHNAEAMAMHKANHPETEHYIMDVFDVDPIVVCAGRAVGIFWMSPTCVFFSKARGAPLSQETVKLRGLCWVGVRWAATVRPRVICLENVEEFAKFGPLHRDHSHGCSDEVANDNGRAIRKRMKLTRRDAKRGPAKPVCLKPCHRFKPIKSRIGSTFRAFIRRLERLGYVVEWKILRACDYGAPTTRRRLFLVARCDGLPIVWPSATHGPGRADPFHTAAECIDWSIECPSIFERSRDLADKTLARIARGIRKFVLENPKPFIVPVAYGDKGGADVRVNDIDEPMRTVCGSRGGHSLVTPIMIKAKTYGGGGNGATAGDDPLGTITASKRGEHAIVTPILVPATHGDSGGSPDMRSHSVDEPLRTMTTRGSQFSIVTPMLVRTAHGEKDASGKKRGRGEHSVEEPLPTVCASSADYAMVESTLIPIGAHVMPNNTNNVPKSVEDPVPTITTGNRNFLVVPYLVHRSNGERQATETTTAQEPRIYDIQKPIGTVVAEGQKHALSVALLVKHHGGHESTSGGQSFDRPIDTVTANDTKAVTVAHLTRYHGERREGDEVRAADVRDPLPTQDTSNRFAVTAAHLIKMRGTSDAHLEASSSGLDEPAPTVTASGTHAALVSSFLVRYNGESVGQPVSEPMSTIDTTDRFGLVTVMIDGEQYVIADIGMRMLVPRELFRAQGFRDSYEIAPIGPNGKPLTKTSQVRMCGNSVPPIMAQMIASAQLAT